MCFPNQLGDFHNFWAFLENLNFTDGSSGHHFHKKVTDSSFLLGKAMISAFNPLQIISTDGANRTTVLHNNALAAAADSIRPLRFALASLYLGISFGPQGQC